MFAAKTSDRTLFSVAFGVMLMTSAWAGWRTFFYREAAAEDLMASLFADGYQPIQLSMPAVTRPEWKNPAAQAQGSEWIYDVFTPPEIYYDPQSRAFSVTPPRLRAGRSDKFDLELVNVHRAPFRLQLVGFVGDDSNALGLFANGETTEHILARAGDRVSSLSVTILAFRVERRSLESLDRLSLRESLAIARVWDEVCNEEITLTNREPAYVGPVVATIISNDSPEERHELRSGETLELEEQSYRLENAELQPPRAELIRISDTQTTPEVRILTLRP